MSDSLRRRVALRGVATTALALAVLAVDLPRVQARPDSGTIAGTVHLVTPSSRRLASAGAYPSRTVNLAAAHNTSELANVVVFVRTAPVSSTPTREIIRQSDQEFVPHLVAIAAGSTIEFPNEDLIFHNVFSLSRGNSFDLGRYPKGQSKSRTFRREGLIKVYCHLHSQMSAIVRVFSHPYFVVPDRQGAFAIPDVPAGTHDVVAWHERVGEVVIRTDVSAGKPASLAFSLPLDES